MKSELFGCIRPNSSVTIKGAKNMQVYLLLTEKCNLKCSMCIRGKQDGKNLDFLKLKNSAWINELKQCDIVITGGEPTLHPDFTEIINFMCEHSKTVTVTTNGTVNKYICPDILKDNLFFQVSIDGDMEHHNNIRGHGTYECSINTIKILDSIKAQYSVSSVVNKNNASSMKNLEKELRSFKNMNYWKISYEMPFGSSGFKNMMTTDEWNNFVDEMLSITKFRLKIRKIFPFDLFEKYKDKLEQITLNSQRCNNCGSGNDKIYIYPDLLVYPCTCLTDFPIGSLEDSSLAEILNGEKAALFSCYSIKNDICKNCEYLRYCNGGCIGMSYHWFNELGMGDMRCPKLSEALR